MAGIENNWVSIEAGVAAAVGSDFRVEHAKAAAGGDINRAYVLDGSGQRYFAKLNESGLLSMFEAEAAALEAILDTGTIRAPRPICAGEDSAQSWLVMEYLPLSTGISDGAATLGERLAALHRSSAPAFGWLRDNTIGSTEQINTPDENWPRFFARQRLGVQLELAKANGAPQAMLTNGERLCGELGAFFGTYQPAPSLLHGDLWGGNWGCTDASEPVIFDPASYFGDREADLAMTELFGGFGDRFYQSYVSAWAIDPGYSTRKVLYNLYHILNHFNLFGGGYAAQAQDMISSLLAEIS